MVLVRRRCARFSATMDRVLFHRGGCMRLAPLVGSVLALASAAIIAQQQPPPASRDRQRELTMNVADGFTIAAVGDCIIARPVSQTPSFTPIGKIIHDADAAF